MTSRFACCSIILGLPFALAAQDLTVIDQFDPPQTSALIGAGFDRQADQIWLYDGGATIESFMRDGTFVGSIAQPGETANDADIAFTPTDITLAGTPVPAGSMLFINGETGPAEVYAIDPADGTVIATLMTQFGFNHVVGGDLSENRNTMYLVADRNDSATPSTIAEIDLTTGAVLRTFGVGANYSVNFGDIALDPATGNVLVVSSAQTTIREITPEGVAIRDTPLPVGVSSLSGIALDAISGDLLLGGTGGTLWRVAGRDQRAPLIGAPGVDVGDSLGASVAISGNIMAVGMPGDDQAGPDAGAVVIFDLIGDTPQYETTILPPPGSAPGYGFSVALDGITLVVGTAPTTTARKGNPVQAAIMQRLAGAWQMKTPVAPAGSPSAGFGASVAVSGETVVVGAPNDSEGASGAGAAFIFNFDGNLTATQRGKFTPTNPAAGQRFGAAVAADNQTVAIAGPGLPGGNTGGFLQVLTQVQSNLTNRGVVSDSAAAQGDEFGASLALSGGTLVAGAPGSGRALSFDLSASSISAPTSLTPVGIGAGSRFGASVAIADDTIAVGAPLAVVDSLPRGVTVLFRGGQQVAKVLPPIGQTGFGSSLSGRLGVLLIGAPETEQSAGAAVLARISDVRFRDGFEE